MCVDDKISFLGGASATMFLKIQAGLVVLVDLPIGDFITTALYGLIGGFFGISGKYLFFWLRDKINGKRDNI